MQHFERAAELYDGEEQTSTANSCKLKVAALAAHVEQYVKAVEIFEAVALASLSNNLLKYSVKSYLLNAGLCQVRWVPTRSFSFSQVCAVLSRFGGLRSHFGSVGHGVRPRGSTRIEWAARAPTWSH
jgi:hypothetical protein